MKINILILNYYYKNKLIYIIFILITSAYKMGLAIYKHQTTEEIEKYYNNIATQEIDNLCKIYETQYNDKKIKFKNYLNTIKDDDELKEEQILVQHNLKMIWEIMEYEIRLESKKIYEKNWNKIDLAIK